ncbi:MAG TPA: Clp protease N-terminal domain-containing protein [Lacunisphaera sp.]|nr:Clp protease N-terminal domain-containing protein [Lacunisphaera sp.]
MKSSEEPPKDWFAWAEAEIADWKARAAVPDETFSPEAVRVVELAARAARSLGHNYVGAEHLLAGIMKQGSGAGVAALERAGLTLPGLREEIESGQPSVPRQSSAGSIPYTPRWKGIIQRARTCARGAGARVEVDDLLRELLVEKEGLPADIFRRRAIDVEKLRAELDLPG